MASFFLLFLEVFLFLNSAIALPISDPKDFKLTDVSKPSPQLYVFGGRDSSDKNLLSVSQFNSSTGGWEATTDMAVANHVSCGVVVGTKIYLFGGKTDDKMVKSAEVYDCETGTYSQFRSMLSPRSDCGAAVLDGFIYIAGGFGPDALSSAFRYDIRTTRRENITSMHIARAGVQLVELNGRLYAIGGNNWESKTVKKQVTNTVEAYNPITDQWLSMADTHYAHEYFGAAVHEGKIYVCSEFGFEVYSPQIDEWEVLPPLNDYRGRALVSMDGKLWALGGAPGHSHAGSKSVFTYNTFTKHWSERADMDVARSFHSAFVVNH